MNVNQILNYVMNKGKKFDLTNGLFHPQSNVLSVSFNDCYPCMRMSDADDKCLQHIHNNCKIA